MPAPNPRCIRPGCQRRIPPHSKHPTCSLICNHVDLMLDAAERLCRAGLAGPDYWAEVVSLSDALTAAHDAERIAKRAAGMSSNDWRKAKRR